MNREQIQNLYNSGFFYFIFSGLISSDNLITKEDYERSIKVFNCFKDNIDIFKDDDKDSIIKAYNLLIDEYNSL